MRLTNKVIVELCCEESNYELVTDIKLLKARVLDTDHDIYLSADNIYDFLEGNKGSVDVLFTKKDKEYPSVQVSKRVTQSEVHVDALYLIDEDTSIRIVDTSGTGLFKWLVRAVSNDKGTRNVFGLNLGDSYYSSIIGYKTQEECEGPYTC